MKIFDLSEKGCNLRIKVEENEGGYPTYVASRFMSPCALEGNPNEEELYNSVKNLDTIFDHKSYDEIAKLLNVHFLGKEETSATKEETKNSFQEDSFEEESIISNSSFEEKSETSSIDEKIEDILKDL